MVQVDLLYSKKTWKLVSKTTYSCVTINCIIAIRVMFYLNLSLPRTDRRVDSMLVEFLFYPAKTACSPSHRVSRIHVLVDCYTLLHSQNVSHPSLYQWLATAELWEKNLLSTAVMNACGCEGEIIKTVVSTPQTMEGSESDHNHLSPFTVNPSVICEPHLPRAAVVMDEWSGCDGGGSSS